MTPGDRRMRVLAQVAGFDVSARPSDVIHRVCRFVVEQLDLSGCVLTLRAQGSPPDALACVGTLAGEVAELQFTLGEGPCVDAGRSGYPAFAADLANSGERWPMFAPAAVDVGVFAEFSLPLQVGVVGLGTLDLSRDKPGMLSEDDLSDALVAADIATGAVLMLQHSAVETDLTTLLEASGIDRVVVHQATGMISAQMDVSPADALVSLRAAAFGEGRSLHEVARDVVERRTTFAD